MEQARFRAAFDFMRLRADIGEVDVVLADWWQEFSQASDALREDLVAALRDEQRKQPRARRVKAQPDEAGEAREVRDVREVRPAQAPSQDGMAEGAEGAAGDAPRKRRRRRRKPAGQGAVSGEAQRPAPSDADED